MTLNEQIQANRIAELESQVEKMTPLVDLVAVIIEDDSFSFYSSAMEINTHTTFMDGETIERELIKALNDIKENT